MDLAIITSHPIQYNAPLFQLIAKQPVVKLKVFYTLGKGYLEIKDNGFGKVVTWDISLLDGYEYEFLENTSQNPGTSNFKGIINPTIVMAVEAFKPDTILIFGWCFDSHLKVLRYFKNKIPVYFRGDSTLLDEQQGIKSLLRRLFLTWVYRHINKALYVGTNNKQYFLQHGVKEQNLIFAPHAIDNHRFGNYSTFGGEGELIRSELRIPLQNIVFLYSGKFQKKKSPILLIRAFKALKQHNLNLVLVGNGELEMKMKEEAQGSTNIHFLPFQNQSRMPSVYRVADVFVLPSSGPGETWGLSINEAMACGLAVIVSNKVGCAIDLLQEGMNGYVFEANNPDSLLEKLSLCASMPKSRLRSMGDVSRIIINVWNYEKTCAAIIGSLSDNTK